MLETREKEGNAARAYRHIRLCLAEQLLNSV